MTTTHGGVAETDYGAMIRALNQVHYAGETSYYGTAPLRPCEEELYYKLDAGTRILDVGCGAGRVTQAITRLGGNIVGVDINEAALAAAKAACPNGTFVHGSMNALPLPSGSFDQVWCLRFSFNALATEAERLGTLSELWRVCSPGGTVLVETFNWHYAGRFGLVRLANILDMTARAVRWYGQRRTGSRPLPSRDIIYLANKASSAAPGYAHLTTVHELNLLAAACGIRKHATVTSEDGVLLIPSPSVRAKHRRYSMWLVLRKPPE
ncbi:class I SAM-dependent methyltransferase [Micromonospora zingiberis]|uniref:Class I SAM-dependent methyltransferase n=1 Tax=Micromonospora zingiberis TaxID=2053011 RepID=A0A4R0GEM3_9ACTN|nr:class I SAM-dependent methyltransferase [Micromonospora zingiberis]TCB95446.1 class I SAM-dependent methyltransferase [Micromonospora zingiberis]